MIFYLNSVKILNKKGIGPKLYFYDTGFVQGDEGTRLENTAAVSLKKHVQYIIDTKGESLQLAYVRLKDGREVDFVVTSNGHASTLIEVKLSDTELSSPLAQFSALFKTAEAFQIDTVRQMCGRRREDVPAVEDRAYLGQPSLGPVELNERRRPAAALGVFQ